MDFAMLPQELFIYMATNFLNIESFLNIRLLNKNWLKLSSDSQTLAYLINRIYQEKFPNSNENLVNAANKYYSMKFLASVIAISKLIQNPSKIYKYSKGSCFALMSDLKDANPTKTNHLYLEKYQNDLIHYKILSDQHEVYEGEIQLSELKGVTKNQLEQLNNENIKSFEKIKKSILSITSEKGHTYPARCVFIINTLEGIKKAIESRSFAMNSNDTKTSNSNDSKAIQSTHRSNTIAFDDKGQTNELTLSELNPKEDPKEIYFLLSWYYFICFNAFYKTPNDPENKKLIILNLIDNVNKLFQSDKTSLPATNLLFMLHLLLCLNTNANLNTGAARNTRLLTPQQIQQLREQREQHLQQLQSNSNTGTGHAPLNIAGQSNAQQLTPQQQQLQQQLQFQRQQLPNLRVGNPAPSIPPTQGNTQQPQQGQKEQVELQSKHKQLLSVINQFFGNETNFPASSLYVELFKKAANAIRSKFNQPSADKAIIPEEDNYIDIEYIKSLSQPSSYPLFERLTLLEYFPKLTQGQLRVIPHFNYKVLFQFFSINEILLPAFTSFFLDIAFLNLNTMKTLFSVFNKKELMETLSRNHLSKLLRMQNLKLFLEKYPKDYIMELMSTPLELFNSIFKLDLNLINQSLSLFSPQELTKLSEQALDHFIALFKMKDLKSFLEQYSKEHIIELISAAPIELFKSITELNTQKIIDLFSVFDTKELTVLPIETFKAIANLDASTIKIIYSFFTIEELASKSNKNLIALFEMQNLNSFLEKYTKKDLLSANVNTLNLLSRLMSRMDYNSNNTISLNGLNTPIAKINIREHNHYQFDNDKKRKSIESSPHFLDNFIALWSNNTNLQLGYSDIVTSSLCFCESSKPCTCIKSDLNNENIEKLHSNEYKKIIKSFSTSTSNPAFASPFTLKRIIGLHFNDLKTIEALIESAKKLKYPCKHKPDNRFSFNINSLIKFFSSTPNSNTSKLIASLMNNPQYLRFLEADRFNTLLQYPETELIDSLVNIFDSNQSNDTAPDPYSFELLNHTDPKAIDILIQLENKCSTQLDELLKNTKNRLSIAQKKSPKSKCIIIKDAELYLRSTPMSNSNNNPSLKEKYETLEKENNVLKEENEALKREISSLRKENASLKRKPADGNGIKQTKPKTSSKLSSNNNSKTSSNSATMFSSTTTARTKRSTAESNVNNNKKTKAHTEENVTVDWQLFKKEGQDLAEIDLSIVKTEDDNNDNDEQNDMTFN